MRKVAILLFLFTIFIAELWSNDSLYALNSLSNTLYLGIDNELCIPEEYKKNSGFLYTTENGIIFKDSATINIIPRRLPDAFINILKVNGGDTILISSQRFFVKYVPTPCIQIAHKCIDETKMMNRNIILQNPELGIYVSDDIIGANDWVKIKRFSLGYVFGSVYKSFETDGNVITDEMKREILNLNPGQQISINATLESNGKFIKYLPVIKITIY